MMLSLMLMMLFTVKVVYDVDHDTADIASRDGLTVDGGVFVEDVLNENIIKVASRDGHGLTIDTGVVIENVLNHDKLTVLSRNDVVIKAPGTC